MPERTRILRPSLWVDATTGTLSDNAFRLCLGLNTCCDDEGWLPWRPPTLFYRDFRQNAGNHSQAVHDFHRSHDGTYESEPVRTSPVLVSVSDSGSDSDSGSGLNRPTTGPAPTSTGVAGPWEAMDPVWWPLREAMARRDYRLPPRGAKDEDGSQRDHLWRLVRKNPGLVARLIDDAPPDFRAGRRPFFDLVRHVFDEWRAVERGTTTVGPPPKGSEARSRAHRSTRDSRADLEAVALPHEQALPVAVANRGRHRG